MKTQKRLLSVHGCTIPAAFLGVIFFAAFALAATDIRALIEKLGGPEEKVDAAVQELKSLPRAQVLSVLKDELSSGPKVSSKVLRAVSAIKATELSGELAQLAMKSEEWMLFHTINQVVDREPSQKLTKIYLERLRGWLPPPAKAAVLDGLQSWQVALPGDLFKALLSDSSFEVRQSALRHFLSTRSRLSDSEQVERFKIAFQTKPYQVRLEAMERFARLPQAERARLKEALSPAACEQESNEKVKKACFELVPEGKKGRGGGKS